TIGHKDVLDLSRKVVITAVKRVVKALGNFKEIIAAHDYIPAGRYFQFVQQRNQAVQNLGNASTHSGGIDHLDRLAAKVAGEKTNFIQFRLANDGRVVVHARGSGRRRLFSVDAWVLAPFNKMG